MAAGRDDGEGAARRQRERRLRSWLKHERRSVAIALSELQHHILKRTEEGQGRGGGAQGQVRSAMATEAPPPRVPGHPVWVSRGGRMYGSRSTTMEQLADVVPMVQILDFPVPQMVEQLVDVFRFFDTLCPVPEQVFEVPKFVCPPRAARTSPLCTAAGGTAGGSADARFLFFSPRSEFILFFTRFSS